MSSGKLGRAHCLLLGVCAVSGCTDGLEEPQSIPRKQPVVRKLTVTDEERRRGRRKTDREGAEGAVTRRER